MKKAKTIVDLSKALAAEGLPNNRITLYQYFDKGILPRPVNTVQFPTRRWMFFSEDEIRHCVSLVRAYVKKHPATTRS